MALRTQVIRRFVAGATASLVGLGVVAVRAGGVEGPPQVLVPAATYVRGIGAIRDPDKFEVYVDAFFIDQDEVTESAYAACVAAKKCRKPAFTSKEPDYPVRGVSWNDAVAYCAFVGRRLPTEAEWERVAFPPAKNQTGSGPLQYTKEPCVALFIGGDGGRSCGMHLTEPEDVILAQRRQQPDDVFYDWNRIDDDHLVFDLFGNVAEWVADWDSPFAGGANYYERPDTKKNPKGPATGTERVIRGGSFAAKWGIGEGDRRDERPTARLRDVGFRCAADLPPHTLEKNAAYREALGRGRKLEKAGDHAGALAAFEAALAAHPDDPAALSELGWAAFQAKDLARATASTERAIATTADARLKAASLYNLGRIEEQQGHGPRAADLYQQSLGLRPSAAVEKRLAALDPAAVGPLSPRLLRGPFPSLEAWNAAALADETLPQETARIHDPSASLARAAGPYRAARLFAIGEVDYAMSAAAAIRTEQGWFVRAPLIDGGDWVAAPEVQLHEVAGAAPELEMRFTSRRVLERNPRPSYTEWEAVCGVGPGGTPSCTPAFVVRRGSCDNKRENCLSFKPDGSHTGKVDWDWSLDVTVLPDGSIRVDRSADTSKLGDDGQRLVGTHRLRFP